MWLTISSCSPRALSVKVAGSSLRLRQNQPWLPSKAVPKGIRQPKEDTLRPPAGTVRLPRLRLEGLVLPRRAVKTIYCRLADDKPRKMLECAHELFCAEDA